MTIIILTGAPGVRKTTIVRDVAQKLKEGSKSRRNSLERDKNQ
jgi:tRNA uridine 5-carbamoylmethylation protein Kti12